MNTSCCAVFISSSQLSMKFGVLSPLNLRSLVMDSEFGALMLQCDLTKTKDRMRYECKLCRCEGEVKRF